ncbi:precorrin-4 C11-methyltransferase [Deinococcus hopiensis KR-140]|uniref:Precorrin-4 C11-methyltransferase n=1 Tax=Deinococcus hopiensis KR-140 TaxID=695939 RepID=A0A1W1UG33_9DEIO|nr:precorrin-4 C11-methyltransferase [Deinococcus hopiensis KR-140]
MKVYFIGAGPGAPDLITLRGARLLGECQLILYAGSLVPGAVLEHAHPGAERFNTAGMHLNEQVALYRRAREQGRNVARVHSGDPAIYGATAEQMRALRELNIPYEVVPGVSSFTASAAVLGAELTRPNVTQTVILTRVSGRASPVPERENLPSLAAHGASLCLFLGGNQLPHIVADLLTAYPPHTPVALVQRASQPGERQHVSTLDRLLSEIRVSEWALTTMLLVSPALSDPETSSCLYDPAYAHRFRRAEKPGGEA